MGSEMCIRDRCLLHEIDHLDGIMYVDKVEGELLSTDDIEEE